MFYFLVAGIAAVLIILPNLSFGQREHLWILLSLPYLFAAVLRLSHKSINLFFAIMIGIFAGAGFAIKPYFLITFILLELFFIYKRKNLLGWARPESLCVLGVIMTYMWSIYKFFPDYLATVVPMLLKYYHIDPWMMMFVNPFLIYSLIIFSLYGSGWKKWQYPILSQVLMLALFGCILSFLVSHLSYFYHALPMLSISTLLATILLANYVKKLYFSPINLSSLLRYLLIWLTADVFSFCLFPIEHIDYSFIQSYHLPLVFLGLLTIVFFDLTASKIINGAITKFFLVASFILTFALSAKPFPQAEQLFFILVFPYICATLLRLHHQPVNHFTALITGIAMGVGVSLNTYLLIPLVLIEFFFLYKERSFDQLLKIELITGLLVAYGLIYGIMQPGLKIVGLNLHWLRNIQIVNLFTPLPNDFQFLELCNFIFCAFVLILQIFAHNKSRYPLLSHFLYFILFGFVFYAFLESLSQSAYSTLSAVIIAGLLITLIIGDILVERYPHLMSSKLFLNTCKVFTFNFAFIFLLFFPLKYFVNSITESIGDIKEGPIASLISYMKAYPNSTFDFYGVDDYLMILDASSKNQFVGKFPMLWWFFAILHIKESNNNQMIKTALKDEKFFIDGLADKLNSAKPRFVITQVLTDLICRVNVKKSLPVKMDNFYNLKTHCDRKSNSAYDYTTVFSTNENFKKAWKHYRFKTDIYFDSYKSFAIYERI
ncbi:MAG: hypothetical protein ACYCQI_07540 [Gammaproteobacteria bacterium]